MLNKLVDRIAAASTGTILLIFAAALLLRILTAIFNVGYFAVDDYNLLGNAIPVQTATAVTESVTNLVNISYIRSPLPQALVYYTALFAHDHFGAVDPVDQARAVFCVMGVLSLASLYFGWRFFLLLGRGREAAIALLLIGFHAAMPFLSTRSMIENMAAPFIIASLYYFTRYYVNRERSEHLSLAVSVLLLALGSLLRFQTGVLLFAYAPFVYLRKNKADYAWFIGAGLVSFVVSGLPDLAMRGMFHGSLRNYIDYNLQYSSEFGTSPPWAYIPTLIIFLIPPAFISRYKGFAWKEQFRPLYPLLLSLAVFFVVHSAIPHKEDRFMFPILPALFVAVAPLANFLLQQPGRLGFRIYFVVVNVAVMIGLTFFTFQNNMIGLVRYMEAHRDIQRIVIFEGSMTYYPYSYSTRGPLQGMPRIVAAWQPPVELAEDCTEVLLIRQNYLESAQLHLANLKEVAEFHASPFERLVVWINPGGNQRRGAMYVYLPKHCPVSDAP